MIGYLLTTGDKPQKEIHMAKTTKRTGYKGPRVSAKIIQLDEAGRQAWLDGLAVSDTERKAIADRLAKAVKKGLTPRKFDLDALKSTLATLPVDVLIDIQAAMKPLIDAGRTAYAAKIKEQMAALQEQARLLEV